MRATPRLPVIRTFSSNRLVLAPPNHMEKTDRMKLSVEHVRSIGTIKAVIKLKPQRLKEN